MKYLYLIRHAKSSWSDPSLSDFDRPLNKRGKRDLPVMGQRMATYEPKPELIISSPAKRARRTARGIGSALGFSKREIVLDEELYTFSPEGFFQVLQRTPEVIQVLAMVGHNHGLTECAEMLSGESLVQWCMGQATNILLICGVIFLVLLAMRILQAVGFIRLLEFLLKPLLPLFGMTHRAAPVTVVGMILGIAYGGALIIKETTKGTMESREIFNSLALMSLSHGLIEDTLVMMALGAKLGGIFWGRLFFSLAVIFVLVKTVDYLVARGKVKPQ